MPAISVVIPLFNKRAYVLRCLESVRQQTLRDFEAVVVDDGSTDGSGDIAAAFPDSRFRVIRQENRGVSAARNRGIREATGELIAFLDADDEWLPLFLEAVSALGAQYPEAGILATGYRRSMSSGFDTEVTLIAPRYGYSRLVPDYLQLAVHGNFVTSSSTAVRRRAVLGVGGFPEGEAFGEDRDLWVRIALQYSVAFDVRILALYRSDAQGRACEKRPASALHPPAVRTLQRVLSEQRVQAGKIRGIHAYIDYLRIQSAYEQMIRREGRAASSLLHEDYFMPRFRVEAAALRYLLKILPMRLIVALRLKPANALTRLKRLRLSYAPCQISRFGDLIIRQVRSTLADS